MTVSKEYQAFIQEQFEPLFPVQAKRMFGSIGLYANATFFAIISDDTLYFKADDQNRPAYEAAQMWAFEPYGDGRRSMSYYAVPSEVLEDQDELRSWAEGAIAAAERSKKRSTGKHV